MQTRQTVIAIVDDEPSVLKGLKRLLGAANIPIETYTSAESFLARGDTSDVACLVLDIHLGGMSGIDLLRRLKALGSTIPVIFMTALASVAVENEAIELGYAAFLHKPFSGQLLIDAIKSATNRDSQVVEI